AVGIQLQRRRGGAERTGRARRLCLARVGLRHRRITPRAQEGRPVRHRPDPGRVGPTGRGAAALRQPARRRHRRRTPGPVRRPGRARGAGAPRHQPRHLRPWRAAGRLAPAWPRAGPVHDARPAVRRGLNHPCRAASRPLAGVSFSGLRRYNSRSPVTPSPGPERHRVRGFLQPGFRRGRRQGSFYLKANHVTQSAILVLEDGTVFEGDSVGASGLSVGEVVFNTSMTGYQEIVTDPSYARQLVTLTYPHIGNTGCTGQDDEATQVWSAGLIVRDVPR